MISKNNANSLQPRISLLAVGDFDREEFLPAIAALCQHADVARAASARQALFMLRSEGLTPHLIVLAQSWPGQFELAEVDRLRQVAPLSRVWELAGTLCEGAMRSGKPWPAVLRCYSHQGAVRFEHQFDRLAKALSVDWDFPVTAGEEERLIARAAEPVERAAGLVVIVAEDRAWSSAIVDAARQRGYASVVLRPGVLRGDCGFVATMPSIEGATAVLWDTTSAQLECPRVIGRLRGLVGDTPIIATVGFPRPEAIRAALANGVAQVVSKPLDVDELFFPIRQQAGAVVGK